MSNNNLIQPTKNENSLPIKDTFQLVSALITIIVFVTGVQNLPSIFGFQESIGIFYSEVKMSISLSILLISLFIFYFCYYYSLSLIQSRVFNKKRPQLIEIKTILFFIIFIALGMGIAFLFFEVFFGSIRLYIDNGNPLWLAIFTVGSLILNLITVYSAFKIEL